MKNIYLHCDTSFLQLQVVVKSLNAVQKERLVCLGFEEK